MLCTTLYTKKKTLMLQWCSKVRVPKRKLLLEQGVDKLVVPVFGNGAFVLGLWVMSIRLVVAPQEESGGTILPGFYSSLSDDRHSRLVRTNETVAE